MKNTPALLLISVFSLFFASGCGISTSEVTSNGVNHFPTVTGTNLHGQEVTFPKDLTKDKTLLLVAFQRWQQELCDAWYARISKYTAENSNVAYYEVPTISKMTSFSRWFIYKGMRGGITDSEMRRKVVTLHIDKEPFKKELNITSEDTVHLYIVDKKGKLLKHFIGSFDDAKWQEAKAIMEDRK